MQNGHTDEKPQKKESIKIHASVDECLEIPPEQSVSPCLFEVEFTQPQEADEFYKKLQKCLPLTGLEYPQLINTTVILTNEQFYCLQINLMQEKGELQWGFLSDQYLMKTLRADHYDFTHQFKLGLIPGKKGRRYNNLRPNERRKYVITSEGDIVERIEKKPQFTPDQKKEYSQIQSNTFLDEKLLAEAFGFFKARNHKLYGLLTHVNDALISRLLIKDSGTYCRPFEFNDPLYAENAKKNNTTYPSRFYPPSKFEEFKQHNLAVRGSDKGTNEVLARLRFNPYRSLIVICSDTLETRLLAEYFSRELLEEYRLYAKANGLSFNPEFRIPIVYYLPTTSYLPGNLLSYRPSLRFYTDKIRAADKISAQRIYNSPRFRSQKFKNNDYEFLLGLPTITPQILLDESTPSGKPLALEMISNGCTRMLSRLLRPVDNSSDNSLINAVFDDLLRRKMIIKNDPIIGNLVLVEEFDLAKKLIDRTTSDKEKLPIRYSNTFGSYSSLLTYLQFHGNPRQLEFIGLRDLVDQNATIYTWTIRKICVKEYPSDCRAFLGKLLYDAAGCKEKKSPAEIKFLLKQGADKTFKVDGYTPIMMAADIQDWVTVSILAQTEADSEDKAHYGYALLMALKNQQRTLVEPLINSGAKALWRKSVPKFELVSTMYYAVTHDYGDLLPQLIEHEKSCPEGFYSRIFYARYFAIARKNHSAITIINDALSDKLSVNQPLSEASLHETLIEATRDGGFALFILRLKEFLRSAATSVVENKHYLSAVHSWWDKGSIIFPETIPPAQILELVIDFEGILIYEELLQFIIRLTEDNLDELFTKLIGISHEENFTYVRRFVEITFQRYGKDLCKEKLDNALSNKQYDCTLPTMVFFIKLGVAIKFTSRKKSDWSYDDPYNALFSDISKNDDHETIFNILDNPRNSNDIKDRLISYVIRDSKNYNIRSLTAHYPIKIDRYNLETTLFTSNEDSLSYFLDLIAQDPNYKIRHYDPLLQIWAYRNHCTSNFIDKFIQQCGTSYIRHLSIMCMLEHMESATSQHWGELEKCFSNIFKRDCRIAPRDSAALENRPGSISPHYYVISNTQSYFTILTLLNDYFANRRILPSSDDTKKTFDTLLIEFRQRVNKQKSFTFFRTPTKLKVFEQKMFDFLSSTEERLSAFEPKVFEPDCGPLKTEEPESLDFLFTLQMF